MRLFARLFGSKEGKPERLEQETEAKRQVAVNKQLLAEDAKEAKSARDAEVSRIALTAQKKRAELIRQAKEILGKTKTTPPSWNRSDFLSIIRDIKQLNPTLTAYIKENPKDKELGFLGCFFWSLDQQIEKALDPGLYASELGQSLTDLKSESRLLITALSVIDANPHCVESVIHLITDSPEQNKDFTLSASSPRGLELMRVYDAFWHRFVYPSIKSPLDSGLNMSVRAYLKQQGWPVD